MYLSLPLKVGEIVAPLRYDPIRNALFAPQLLPTVNGTSTLSMILNTPPNREQHVSFNLQYMYLLRECTLTFDLLNRNLYQYAQCARATTNTYYYQSLRVGHRPNAI